MGRESDRRRSVIPELLKRAVEVGVEKASEAPDTLKHFVGDLKLPKEIVSYLFSQVDETKNGLFRVVAKEIRDFLEHANLSGELQKVLTALQFEVSTTIRFRPNDGSPPRPSPEDDEEDHEATRVRPEVKSQLHVRREGRARRNRGEGGT